jgi:predicted nucleic acid-binding protein
VTGVLIDSDVLIEVLRGRRTEVVRKWTELVDQAEPLFCSPVSIAEIRHGMRSHERESTERVIAALVCIPIDAEIGARAGDYLRAYRASHMLELADALIAATASRHALDLWTRNQKHFPMKDLALLP